MSTRFGLSLSFFLLSAGLASAQDFPSKPIRIVTGGAGGGSDMQTRLIAQNIAGPMGQPVIVENRVGFLAADTVAKAAPDGYTLIINGGYWRHQLVLPNVPYDGVRDFTPVTLVSRDVNVIAVNPSLPVKSIKELIALAKSKPGELNYAIGAPGSTTHLATELFNHMAGVNIVKIPHKGGAQSIASVVGGQVHMIVLDAGLLMPLARSGKLRALAVTSAAPSVMAPGLPTVAASGLPGYEAVGMTGMCAPVKTPAAVINRVNQEVVRFLRTPEAKEAFFKMGTEAADSTPEQFAAIIRSDVAAMAKLIKEANIKVE